MRRNTLLGRLDRFCVCLYGVHAKDLPPETPKERNRRIAFNKKLAALWNKCVASGGMAASVAAIKTR